MTTVLAIRQKNKVILVSDTQATGGTKAFEIQKIYQIAGYTFAGAGALKAIQDTVRRLNKEIPKGKKGYIKPSVDRFAKRASFLGHTEYLVALKGHLYEVGIDGSIVEHGHGQPAALGTGGDYAIGALVAGASPTDAVQIAAAFDVYSGGEVVEVVVK